MSHLGHCLAGDTPVIAATDYVAAWPQLVAPYLDAPFTALGTDGFGRSDTRNALRRFFEVDRQHVVIAALRALQKRGVVDAGVVESALQRYGIDVGAAAPWSR